MTEDERPTPRPGQPRVVKKVVKRTVVRPGQAPGRTSSGRTSTASSPATSSPTAVAPAPAPAKATPGTGAAARLTQSGSTTTTTRRGSIDLGAARRTGRQGTQWLGRTARAGLSSVRRSGTGARGFVVDRYWDVRTYRLPPQPPVRSALVVGLVLGLLAVAVGWVAGMVFSELRGTSSGGGVWGGLVVVTLGVVSVYGGGRLLRALGVDQAMTVSLLAVILVLIAILLFFVDLASGQWALLVVPALAAAAYAASTGLITLASTEDRGEIAA